jgi:hypothetical protein
LPLLSHSLRRHPERSEGSLYSPLQLPVFLFVIPLGSAVAVAVPAAIACSCRRHSVHRTKTCQPQKQQIPNKDAHISLSYELSATSYT